VNWQCKRVTEALTDLSTTTNTGRIADLIDLAVENSGMSRFYVIGLKPNVNTRMVNLLRQWIEEYGDDEDPDLDLQLAELRSNRLALREQC
jgi:hypothetical protein